MGWPSIEPGDLRHRITALDQVTVQDASGYTASWVPASPPLYARAKIVPLRGIEALKSGQDVSKLYSTVTIRFAEGWAPNMRFTDENENYYLIQAIRDVEKRQVLLEMTCLEIGAND